MTFAEPLRLLLVLLATLPFLRERYRASLPWPTVTLMGKSGPRPLVTFRRYLSALCASIAIVCVSVAAAEPREPIGSTRISSRGVSIMIVLDRSSSMNTKDLPAATVEMGRLDAVKEIVSRFVEGRPGDRIGLVAFANYPDLSCPLTLKHDFVLDTLRSLKTAKSGDDGTNLGDALVWALDSLRDARTAKKVVILMSDGRNEPAVPSPFDPVEAARLASGLGVVLHTVAVGKPGGLSRRTDPKSGLPFVSEVPGPDLSRLADMARLGGGRAFLAVDLSSLAGVFAEIDRLEKSDIDEVVHTRYRSLATPWLATAACCLVLSQFSEFGVLRRTP